jgi:hypothetical protein
MAASEYRDYQLIQHYIYPWATFGEEPWAAKLKALPEELIPMFQRVERRNHAVLGRSRQTRWKLVPTDRGKREIGHVAVHLPSWMEDTVPHLGRERMSDVDLARILGTEGVPCGIRRRPLDRGPSLLI